MLKTAYQHYDLSGTKQMMVGGDYNCWVRQSFDMVDLPTEFVLDRYHLFREAWRAFGSPVKQKAGSCKSVRRVRKL